MKTFIRRTWDAKIFLLLLPIALAACDFEVSNPGPLEDAYLNLPQSHEAMVNGMMRELSHGLEFIAYTGAAVAREMHPSGSVAAFGITIQQQHGQLTPEQTSTEWNNAQRARWVAENGLDRFREILGESEAALYPPAARAALYAGFSNRLLGENMCEAVINRSGRLPHTEFLERAESAFSTAIAIAAATSQPDVLTAAYAGRASARVGLGDWSGAVQDAAEVPDDFEFLMMYSMISQAEQNRVWYGGNSGTPFRALSTWNTFYEEYFTDSGDPRTPWGSDPDHPFGDSDRDGIGPVPWYFQLKYTRGDSPIRLAGGGEMRLIEAEALLREGQWEDAMVIINGLRGSVGVDPWTAGDIDDAWTFLKRERGIELWLEARRLGDLRRWTEEGVPGDLHPLELIPGRDLCYPIPNSELETNPNL